MRASYKETFQLTNPDSLSHGHDLNNFYVPTTSMLTGVDGSDNIMRIKNKLITGNPGATLMPSIGHFRNYFLMLVVACCVLMCVMIASAQTPSQSPETSTDATKKANMRSAAAPTPSLEPFEGATVEKMATQCATLETEAGSIEIEMMPEVAPESVRNFLNLVATGALDTTTFSRVLKGFVIQGGNLSTSEKWGVELSKRAQRKIPDEPGLVKHVRGIVSMARSDEPNSASTSFFILVGEGPHLNGKFAAFGRVRRGLEVADSINGAPADGDKPAKPVRINRATVAQCPE